MVPRVFIDRPNWPIPKRLRTNRKPSKQITQLKSPTLIDRIEQSLTWQTLLENGSTKSQIAKRAGIKTKRITELLWLAKLPKSIIEKIRSGHHDYAEWSTNQAIKESCRLYKINEVQETIKKVQKWKKLIAQGVHKAEIARREGYSRARVTQLMKLADFNPDTLDQVQHSEKPITLRELLSMAR